AILLTHSHYDHFSEPDIRKVRRPGTEVWGPADVAQQLDGEVKVVAPGDAFETAGLSVDAVPAYNLARERLGFHPRERGWVGFVIAVDGVRYYHAGDTDLIPEMEAVDCDVAMLPIGGTFTMDVAEAAEAARIIAPKLVVPMHYGFVAGTASDARRFAALAAPLEVRALIPESPFER
ncbi:MAG: MBL fold metallo-hydrolase, partial [Actinomycetota bacterium]